MIKQENQLFGISKGTLFAITLSISSHTKSSLHQHTNILECQIIRHKDRSKARFTFAMWNCTLFHFDVSHRNLS
jgi:hypothetical protein